MTDEATGPGPVGEATGPGTGPVGQRAARPPVPPTGRAPRRAADGEHRTERVPFPLPAPGAVAEPSGAPTRTGQPETGALDLGGYPPRVPGAAGRRPVRPGATPDEEASRVDDE